MNPRFTGHENPLSNNDGYVNTELTKPDPISGIGLAFIAVAALLTRDPGQSNGLLQGGKGCPAAK
jgi:hypothetical protein